jgi:hypothetical protein
MLHAKHCAQPGARELSPAMKIGAKTAAGAGVGVAAVILGTAMVSLVGGAAVLHALLWKLGVGAGLAGGGVGLAKGLGGIRNGDVLKR